MFTCLFVDLLFRVVGVGSAAAGEGLFNMLNPRQPLKEPPANPRTWAFLVLKCNFWFYPPKTEICHIGGVKKFFDLIFELFPTY